MREYPSPPLGHYLLVEINRLRGGRHAWISELVDRILFMNIDGFRGRRYVGISELVEQLGRHEKPEIRETTSDQLDAELDALETLGVTHSKYDRAGRRTHVGITPEMGYSALRISKYGAEETERSKRLHGNDGIQV